MVKVNSFVINPLDYAAVEDATDEIIGIVHSHPQNILDFLLLINIAVKQ